MARPEVKAQTARYVSPAGTDIASCGEIEQPCKSISHALDIADSADTLSLAAGIYFESGIILEKDVVIVGDGAESTFIDGDGVDGTRTYFLSAMEDALLDVRTASEFSVGKSTTAKEAYAGLVQSIVDQAQNEWYGSSIPTSSGFVIRVGSGVTAEIESLTIRDGGGFRERNMNGGIVNAGRLVVRKSVLEHNVAFHADMDEPNSTGRGGAILNIGSLSVEETTIRRNFAVGFALSGGSGGGIYNEGRLTVLRSTIDGNEAWDTQDFCKGGGIANQGDAEIRGSRIVGNSSDCFEGGAGGGVYNSGSLYLDGTIVAENSARSVWEYSAGQGGGVANYDELTMVNSTVTRNISGSGGGVYSNGPATVASSTIVGNGAVDRPYTAGVGGGLSGGRDASFILWSTIVAGNLAGGDVLASSADCDIDADRIESDFVLTGDATGCTGSALTVDPAAALQDLFGEITDDTYAFVPVVGSPAIDTGDCRIPGDGPLSLDQLGNARPFDHSGIENTSDGCDIGAVESQSSSGEKSSNPLASSAEKTRQFELALGQNYPNPFGGSTRIEFTVPATEEARVVIYDLMGREIDRLVDGTVTRGKHSIEWTADGIASGVYLCRLTVGSSSDVRRLTLAR